MHVFALGREHVCISTKDRAPVLVLKEGSSETKGKDARKNNIAAAKLIAEVMRSSLGPRGMDKMLVDPIGDVTITNDGATILKQLEIEHPVGKMLVELAKSVDIEAGDGTKSVVVLAGSLIENAEELFDKGVHPAIVVEGFREASKKAIEFLKEISVPIDPKDKDFLNKISTTTIASKLVTTKSELLSRLVVDAALSVAEESLENKFKIDLDDIKVERKAGGSLQDSQLTQGIVIDKEVVHPGMPKRIQNAKIALINSESEIEKPELDTKLRITTPDQMQKFLSEEERMIKSMADKVISAGANVILCQKGIDDMAQHFLAKEGLIGVRRIKESDMTKLARATGARIVTNIDELSENDIGHADLIEERNVETDKWVFIEGCKHPKSITILIRGGSQRVVDEADRSIHDALMVIKDAVEYPYVVVGGGAPEVVVSKKLREWSTSLANRHQLAVEKYADSLESIPLTLAENAGMSIVDSQAELRTKSQSTGKPRFGIDVFERKISDLSSTDIYEPLSVKNEVVNSGTEAACMILRIDDVISASKGAPSAPGSEA